MIAIEIYDINKNPVNLGDLVEISGIRGSIC